MIIRNSASKASIEDFRDHVARGLGPASEVLFNIIDVLAIGPRPTSPVELTLSPCGAIDGATFTLASIVPAKSWATGFRRSPIRFMKGDLGLTCGQFNSTEAEGRVQVWVEMVATAFWFCARASTLP
jgi:hypothetical protein